MVVGKPEYQINVYSVLANKTIKIKTIALKLNYLQFCIQNNLTSIIQNPAFTLNFSIDAKK